MIKCPYCNASKYAEENSFSTMCYYPPIYENGVNINPNKNKTTTICRCLECGKKFTVTEGVVDPAAD